MGKMCAVCLQEDLSSSSSAQTKNYGTGGAHLYPSTGKAENSYRPFSNLDSPAPHIAHLQRLRLLILQDWGMEVGTLPMSSVSPDMGLHWDSYTKVRCGSGL